jgi:hypothetical protein
MKNSITINDKEFPVPEPVLKLMILISKERDHYKTLLSLPQPEEVIH